MDGTRAYRRLRHSVKFRTMFRSKLNKKLKIRVGSSFFRGPEASAAWNAREYHGIGRCVDGASPSMGDPHVRQFGKHACDISNGARGPFGIRPGIQDAAFLERRLIAVGSAARAQRGHSRE